MTAAALTAAALTAFAVAVAVRQRRQRRRTLALWWAADVERAARRWNLDLAVVERAAACGVDPDDAARAVVLEGDLIRAWQIGAAAERLPPELRDRPRPGR
jgi:hypothetical protein